MRCAICPRAIDDLRREGAPLRQCGRASLLVYEPGDEMPLLIEWLWTYKAARKLEWTEFHAQLGKRLEIMKQLFHDRARKARRSWLTSSSSGQLGGVAARDMRPRRILRARLRIAWACARDPGGGRRPPEQEAPLVMPASKNLHKGGHSRQAIRPFFRDRFYPAGAGVGTRPSCSSIISRSNIRLNEACLPSR